MPFNKWYKETYGTEPPDFLAESTDNAGFDIDDYLDELLGKCSSTVNNLRRRWRILRAIAKYVYEKKTVTFEELVKWSAPHCDCINTRTLKENFVEYLDMLGIIQWNEITKTITWKGGRGP